MGTLIKLKPYATDFVEVDKIDIKSSALKNEGI